MGSVLPEGGLVRVSFWLSEDPTTVEFTVGPALVEGTSSAQVKTDKKVSSKANFIAAKVRRQTGGALEFQIRNTKIMRLNGENKLDAISAPVVNQFVGPLRL